MLDSQTVGVPLLSGTEIFLFTPGPSVESGWHIGCSNCLRAGRPRDRSSSHSSVGLGQEYSPCRPNRFCDPSNLLSNGYREQSDQGVKLTTRLHLLPRSRKCGSIHPLLHTPSWRSAQLVKHRDNFNLPFTGPFEQFGVAVTHRTCNRVLLCCSLI
jgi:hypothetical protein